MDKLIKDLITDDTAYALANMEKMIAQFKGHPNEVMAESKGVDDRFINLISACDRLSINITKDFINLS